MTRKRILTLPRLKRFKVFSEVGFAVVGGSKLLMNTFVHRMLKVCVKEIGKIKKIIIITFFLFGFQHTVKETGKIKYDYMTFFYFWIKQEN